MYKVITYQDAHGEPTDVERIDDIGDAVERAKQAAASLATESDGALGIGSAGDGEILEVYPLTGHGTVVVAHD